jgi:drug/metabolite transporter (DMT)-like permease
VAAGLFLAIFLWGGNNTGVKYLVKFWPPVFTGCTRFLAAGLILTALLRWTRLFGPTHAVSRELNARLWRRASLSLALYILAFNWALKLTSVSHVTLYLGAAPVWALLWEGRPKPSWQSAQRYGSAALAFCGVAVLLWPSLHHGVGNLRGEFFGIACGFIWPLFGLQCRDLGGELTGPEISAHTCWRAGLILAPISLVEISTRTPALRVDLLLIHLFCVLGGTIVAYALWNGALRYWKASQVYLFNNLVPLSSMAWAHYCLNEPITATFWTAMLLIGAGVLLGQTNWQKIFGRLWIPNE